MSGLKWLWEEATKTVVRTLTLGALTMLLAVGASIWGYGKLLLRSQVADMIVSELQVGQSRIAEALDTRIAQSLEAAFADRVGSVSAGRFRLDAANSTQLVFIYLPPGHDGHLYVVTNGIARGERVVMSAPGANRSFAQDAAFEPLDIAALLAVPGDPQAEAISDAAVPTAAPLMGEMKHLHRLGFQLTHDPESAPQGERLAKLTSGVDVRYLTIVSPPLRRALR